MFATVDSLVLNGIEALPVRVEVDVHTGLPHFDLVGLPSASVREARERVRAAIKNSGFEFPLCRITVNLAPADLRKEGSHLDLPIAAGILIASGQAGGKTLPFPFLVGELSLEGTIRPVPGVLPMVLALSEMHPAREMIVPPANQGEASLIPHPCLTVPNLQRLASFLSGTEELDPVAVQAIPVEPTPYDIDFSDIKGQNFAKRAIEVAVAGGHNILLVGPPGSGKTMLARRIPTIMPVMTREEILETTQIYSVAGLLNPENPLITCRPFRSPHRNASSSALVGGGRIPRPGEISLAQNGVLYLDEITEFPRDVLESLRQPLEDRIITVTRTHSTSTYPCRFTLVASCNPCPCGFLGDQESVCRCTPHQVSRYFGKISGPLMDRMDLQVEVPRVAYENLTAAAAAETSDQIRARIEDARRIQARRFEQKNYSLNAEMKPREVRAFCRLNEEAEAMMRSAFKSLNLSARGYDRVLKVARTIADLTGSNHIRPEHLAEAIQYRGIERRYRSAFA